MILSSIIKYLDSKPWAYHVLLWWINGKTTNQPRDDKYKLRFFIMDPQQSGQEMLISSYDDNYLQYDLIKDNQLTGDEGKLLISDVINKSIVNDYNIIINWYENEHYVHVETKSAGDFIVDKIIGFGKIQRDVIRIVYWIRSGVPYQKKVFIDVMKAVIDLIMEPSLYKSGFTVGDVFNTMYDRLRKHKMTSIESDYHLVRISLESLNKNGDLNMDSNGHYHNNKIMITYNQYESDERRHKQMRTISRLAIVVPVIITLLINFKDTLLITITKCLLSIF